MRGREEMEEGLCVGMCVGGREGESDRPVCVCVCARTHTSPKIINTNHYNFFLNKTVPFTRFLFCRLRGRPPKEDFK